MPDRPWEGRLPAWEPRHHSILFRIEGAPPIRLKFIGEKGLLHLQSVNHPHATTKASLQPKRYQAHLVGTTYVYDFPDLCSKALHNLWSKARDACPSLALPKKLLESKKS